MRKELKPNLEYAEKIFPQVNKLVTKAFLFLHKNYENKFKFNFSITEINDYVRERLEYKTFVNIENKLTKLTGKDMHYYHNSKFWLFASDIQSFILSVPDPPIILNITKNELTEIITKIWKRGFLEEDDMKYSVAEYGYHLIHYYKKILKINFKNYNSQIIEKYDFCFSNCINENIKNIVDKIWEGL